MEFNRLIDIGGSMKRILLILIILLLAIYLSAKKPGKVPGLQKPGTAAESGRVW
jgi:hypothetical protein